MYAIALFLHVTGALGLGAVLGIEWTGLFRLRAADTPDEARQWAAVLRPTRWIGGPSMLLLLLSGIYMTATRWAGQPWIAIALLVLIVMAVLGGGVTARRMRSLLPALGQSRDRLDPATRELLADSVLPLSLQLRTALLIGILMLMTTRPGWLGSSLIFLASALVGLGSALLGGHRGRVAPEASSVG